MSHVTYLLKGSTADGELISVDMSHAYERCYLSVVYYSDDFITSVIPTAGTLTCTGSETGERYGEITNGTLDATVEQYNRPAFYGSVKNIKAVALGITGAINYTLRIDRFER